jgi:hypothetical protein
MGWLLKQNLRQSVKFGGFARYCSLIRRLHGEVSRRKITEAWNRTPRNLLCFWTCAGSGVSMESAVFGAVVGILLGRLQLLKVFSLFPAMVFVVSWAVLHGKMGGQSLLTITLTLLCAVASLEIGYAIFAIAGECLPRKVAVSNAELFRAVRTAIGRELKMYFQLPKDVPPEMAAMLSRLAWRSHDADRPLFHFAW